MIIPDTLYPIIGLIALVLYIKRTEKKQMEAHNGKEKKTE